MREETIRGVTGKSEKEGCSSSLGLTHAPEGDITCTTGATAIRREAAQSIGITFRDARDVREVDRARSRVIQKARVATTTNGRVGPLVELLVGDDVDKRFQRLRVLFAPQWAATSMLGFF